MKEIVILRELKGSFEVKCPLCNTEQVFDKTDNMHDGAITKCEGCGGDVNFQLLAIRPLQAALSDDSFDENDTTLMMSKQQTPNKNEQITVIPTQKLVIEKSAFYVGEVSCPFCDTKSLVRYNAIAPHLAQWCPTETCKAEFAITIWVIKQIGGNLSDWYKKTELQGVENE